MTHEGIIHTQLFSFYQPTTLFINQRRPIQFGNPIKLTTTRAATDWTNIVVGKPANHVVGMTTVLAPHTPTEPFRKGEIRGVGHFVR